MRRVLVLAVAVAAVVAVAMGAGTMPQKQRVYMFGFAASFVDSVCVMTDLQEVDAYVMPNGFLADRSLYSLQLNNHLVSNQMLENLTCVVFFDKNKSKAEKKYQKLRKRYREDENVTLQSLGIDQFRFEAEEWVEPEAVVEPKPEPETKGKKKERKK